MPLVVVVVQAVWVCTRDGDCLSGTTAFCQVSFVRVFYFVSGTSILFCQGLRLFVRDYCSLSSVFCQGLLLCFRDSYTLLSGTTTVCQGLLLFVKCILAGTSTLFQGLLYSIVRDSYCLPGTTALCQVYFVRDFYFVSGTSISIVRDSCFLFRNSSLPT